MINFTCRIWIKSRPGVFGGIQHFLCPSAALGWQSDRRAAAEGQFENVLYQCIVWLRSLMNCFSLLSPTLLFFLSPLSVFLLSWLPPAGAGCPGEEQPGGLGLLGPRWPRGALCQAIRDTCKLCWLTQPSCCFGKGPGLELGPFKPRIGVVPSNTSLLVAAFVVLISKAETCLHLASY